MTDNDVADLNRRLNPFGYEVELRNGFYFLGFIGDRPRLKRLYQTREDAENAAASIENCEWWRLDLSSDSVEFDRDRLLITPVDGSRAFQVNAADGQSGSGPYTDGRGAEYLYYKSKEHPPLGGRWHKWGAL